MFVLISGPLFAPPAAESSKFWFPVLINIVYFSLII